jgi:uncharacterized membrane protein YbjE (DUF340 family)
VSLGEQSVLIFWAAVVCYFAAIFWFSLRGSYIRAGLVSGVIAFIPELWQELFTDFISPLFTLTFLLMLPLSLVLIVVGIANGEDD